MRTCVLSEVICLVAVFGSGAALAQPAPGSHLRFEAASIKPADAASRGYSFRPLGNRLVGQNLTLKMMIGEAYHVYDFQVSGGPKWIDGDRYNLEAKAGGDRPPTLGQFREMLQALLADRFGLDARRESREMQVLTLEPAKSGVRIEPTKHPEAPVLFRVFQRRQITAENAPLEYLTEALNVLLGRPVLDRTGLEGNLDYKLEWAPDETQVQSQEAPAATDGAAPSLVAALQQQLGLRLSSKRAPVEFIVVDRAEKPTAN